MIHSQLAAPQVPPIATAGRRAWAALEPLHNYLYFDPGATDLFATAAGLSDRRMGYFAARASALGEVGAMPVIAMFYNFSPASVHRALPALWESVTPAVAQATRQLAADQSLRIVLGEAADSPELLEALTLARKAAEAASAQPHGRPLFAAHAALPWPDQPHVALWHAQTLLREFRGDGHSATLLSAGISGLDALILYTATEKVDGDQLRLIRGWSRAEWNDAVASLTEQGLVTSGPELDATQRGRQLRQWIEATTDLAAVPAYEAIGVEGSDRLAELSVRLNAPVIAADVIPWLKKMKTITRRGRLRGRVGSRSAG